MTFSRLIHFTLAVLIAGTFSARSFGQAEAALPAKKVVRSVQVISAGGAQIDENRIKANMGTRAGAPFEEEVVERDIKNLYATGLVESVDITTQDAAGGVNVIVKVTGRGAIGEVAFTGNTVYDADRLRKEVEVKINEPVEESKLFTGANKIRELYNKKGFADVGVEYKLESLPTAGFVRVVYHINEGSRGIIHDIRFEGLTAVKESALRSKLKLKEKRIWHLWGKAGKLNNDDLQEDIRTVERAVQDRGYVYAKVVQVRREPVGGDKIDLVYVVDEGKQYSVSDVAIEGNTVFTSDELNPALIMEGGAAYSATDISADEKMLSEYYGSRGYADARIDTSVIPAGADSVKILYRITEGEKSYIRKINIEGNTKTQDRVIRRELAFAPGEEFNTVRIERSRSRLTNMGYFSAVDFRNNPTGTPGYKDIDITVTEQSTGSINVGAGFSSIDSLVGFFSLTQTNFDITNWPNFTGGGERFNIDIRAGDKRRDFSISWVQPWLFGHRLSFGVDLFYRDLYYLSDVYDQREYGASFNLRKPIGEHAYVEGVFTSRQVEIMDVDDDASQIIKDEEGEYFQNKIDFSLVHDTRDSVYLTTKGHKVQLGAMVSAGGDVDAYGFSLEGAQYFSLPYNMIFSLEGALRAVDGDDVPIFERLFLGGANNLRGFDYRDVGPKDENGEPIGGLTSAYMSAELTFPIIEKVRGAVFYDVGMVSGDSYDWGGDVNSDVGIGLRLYFLPTGPIRLDFGIPVQADEDNDSSGQFNFNLGYRF
ncbi:Beta-barrel assembly machine subunit BamA [Roseimicrobium gellanilyticum]|uniref:Outer membrane protein assembly factor BamA n=1 Tax=Roseimicrobium gellanilyticum TaxID=748857 RepID=A0A366HT23_9BACT|nr:outer membrane protein assembly factor BamA [Roseimicrobium gellanilyticum]RBP47426.1 Beta-barrel assembly machine subunit BamA [Roseimicrobium gellanilyticum]